MAERFAITEIFDPLFKGISRDTGVPTEDYSAMFGGQVYGQLLDIVFDLTMQPAVAGVAEGVVGIGTLLYSTMAEGVDPRLRKELFSMGTKLALEVLDPRTWESKKASADIVMSKINQGDIVGALFKPPEDILKALGIKEQKKKTYTPPKKKAVVKVQTEVENVEEEEEEMWRKLSA